MRSLERIGIRLKLAHRIGWTAVFRYLKYRAIKKMRWYEWQGCCHQREIDSLSGDIFRPQKRIFEKPSTDVMAPFWNRHLETKADEITENRLTYFSFHKKLRPQSWRESPLTQFESPLKHWSQIPDFDARQGDIKWIWELSRFEWVYTLGRAFACTRNDRYRNSFLSLVRDWSRDNPFDQGVNWRDGQECSLRAIALIWSLSAFDLAANDERFISELIVRHLYRIRLTLDYALSQRNNHGLSEACALFLGALTFPQLPRASYWRDQALKNFETQVVDQFLKDGWYSQDSVIYMRFALRLCVLTMHAANVNQMKVASRCVERIRGARQLLDALIVGKSGETPNYGANDGTSFMQLSDTNYLDFRPTLELLHFILNGKRLSDEKSCLEELIWIFGESAAKTPREVKKEFTSFEARDSGLFIYRPHPDQFGFLRCGSYKNRPSHSDSLHFDWWYQGVNIAVDSGTFQYFDEKNWGHYFKSTAAHNTLVMNEQSQMREWSRFLWADWVVAEPVETKYEGGETPLFVGRHRGYQKRFGILHERALYFKNQQWRIVDTIRFEKNRSQDCELRWHLAQPESWNWNGNVGISEPLGIRCEIQAAASDQIVWRTGSSSHPETAASLYYGESHAIGLLSVTRKASQSFSWTTCFELIN